MPDPTAKEQYIEEWKQMEGEVIHVRIGDVEHYEDIGTGLPSYFTVNMELLEGPDPEKIISFDLDTDRR